MSGNSPDGGGGGGYASSGDRDVGRGRAASVPAAEPRLLGVLSRMWSQQRRDGGNVAGGGGSASGQAGEHVALQIGSGGEGASAHSAGDADSLEDSRSRGISITPSEAAHVEEAIREHRGMSGAAQLCVASRRSSLSITSSKAHTGRTRSGSTACQMHSLMQRSRPRRIAGERQYLNFILIIQT